MALLDSWLKKLDEASKLGDDITSMISELGSLSSSGLQTQRHASATRRNITMLGTKLDTLDVLLSKILSKTPRMDKELHRCQEMLANLIYKRKEMASALNMSNMDNRDDLLGLSRISVDEINRASGLDNQWTVGLQRQIMREQDEDLDKLEHMVRSTKHIALTINGELDLHTRLIDNLDQHVEITDSKLQKRLAILK